MTSFEWRNEYSVGVSTMDEQHGNLVSMMNELYDSIGKGRDESIIRSTLDKLLDYTAYHFVTEERLLEQNGYPGVRKQREEHEALTWRVLDMRSRYLSGEGVAPTELLDFLTGWLKNHLLTTDKQYGAYLNSKGVH